MTPKTQDDVLIMHFRLFPLQTNEAFTSIWRRLFDYLLCLVSFLGAVACRRTLIFPLILFPLACIYKLCWSNSSLKVRVIRWSKRKRKSAGKITSKDKIQVLSGKCSLRLKISWFIFTENNNSETFLLKSCPCRSMKMNRGAENPK